jgi:hypothetical protein
MIPRRQNSGNETGSERLGRLAAVHDAPGLENIAPRSSRALKAGRRVAQQMSLATGYKSFGR